MEGDADLKTLKIKERTYKELSELREEMKNRSGESKTYDQVVQELIDCFKRYRYTASTRTVIFGTDRPPPGTLDPYYKGMEKTTGE